MAELKFFIFDDKEDSIREMSKIVARYQNSTKITIEGMEYRKPVISCTSLEECQNILEQPENLESGGILFLDWAFDDNNPQNIDMFSLEMLKRLKQKLTGKDLPYGIVFVTAFDEDLRHEYFERDGIVSVEKIGYAFKKEYNGRSIQDQVWAKIEDFTHKYKDQGNGKWRRTDKLNDWLEKYEIGFQQISHTIATEYLSNVYGKESKKFPSATTRLRLNQIVAIEKVKINDDIEYVIYPNSTEVLPFFVRSISFPNLEKNLDFEKDIWAKYNPSTEEKYTNILELFSSGKEALPFLRIHGNFLIMMPFIDIRCTLREDHLRPNNNSTFALFKWAENRLQNKSEHTLYNHRAGYIKCFRGKGEVYFPFGGGQKGKEIRTDKWQQSIINIAIDNHSDWYAKIREIR